MTTSFSEISWPAERLGELVETIGQRCRLGPREAAPEAGHFPPGTSDEHLGRWIEAAASWLGFEAEPVEAPYPEVETLLGAAGPALLRVTGEKGRRFLALLSGNRRRLAFLTPDQAVVHLPLEEVRAALCREVEAAALPEVERIVEQTAVSARRRPRARRALLRGLLGDRPIGGCWLLRPGGGADVLTQVREGGLPGLLAVVAGAHVLESVFWLLSWWLLGWMTFENRLEPGWLLLWLLLLGALVPFRLLAVAAGGELTVRAGALVKRRLLVGALRMGPDEVRHQGAGQLLGRVIESEVIESVALAGGFLALTAAIELGLAGLVFAGAGRAALGGLLLGWTVVTALLVLRSYRRRRAWTGERMGLTNDLVEGMVGHRTRLAQERADRRNEGADQALERYLGASGHLDESATTLQALVPRGWFLVGLLGLAPFFLRPGSTSLLAVAVGGVVLAYRGFRHLVEGLDRLSAAAVAWEQNQPFWHAAALPQQVGHPAHAVVGTAPGAGQPVLDGRGLVFSYREAGPPILRGLDVSVRAGERVLLQGPSGGGKSTLAMLLAGGRPPTSGLLLLQGLDRKTMGDEGWRRRVVLAPQYHDNHVLMGTLAFNALLGRGWPPSRADLAEVERVCQALGLGPLLERMPGGLLQIVGETGWQLSQGEKSRLYIARAVLQGADVVILDESFGALDPQTLQRSLAFVLAEAPTVVVIAHP